MAAILHVVVLRKRRDHGGAAFDLADAVQDDFGAALVGFYGSADFDGAPGETADVADIFQVVGENHDRERTGHSIFTEVKEVNALVPDVDADDLPGYAFRFANVLAGFVDRDAVGCGRGAGKEEGGEEREKGFCSPEQCRSCCQVLPGRTGEGARPHTSRANRGIPDEHEVILGIAERLRL